MLLLLFSFVCSYFSTPNLALLVLVSIHCDFNKFHFDFFKKKKIISFIIKEYKIDGTTLKIWG